MATEQPSAGPQEQPERQEWVGKTVNVLRTSTPEKRTDAFRILLQHRTLNDLQELAKNIELDTQLHLSQEEEVALAERVRALIPEEKLEALLQNQNFDKRLELLDQRRSLLTLVSRHLQPEMTDTAKSWAKKAYEWIADTSSPIGSTLIPLLKKLGLGNIVHSGAAFVRKLQWGFYSLLESPLGAPVRSMWLIGPSVEQWARKNRTFLELDDHIRDSINTMRGRLAMPFIEFEGVNDAAFNALVLKHLPKDSLSQDLTPAMCTEMIRDISAATGKYITFRKQQDATCGDTEAHKLTIRMADLVDFDPEKQVQVQQQAASAAEKQKIVQNETWNNAGVKSVEFGSNYSFSKTDGKLTLPKESMDSSGVPINDASRLLQKAVQNLSSFTQDISVVSSGRLELSTQKTILPVGRGESVADYVRMFGVLNSHNERVNILREVQDQTMTADIRYIGESGKGVLEWKSTLIHPAEALKGFFASNPLQGAVAGTKWKKNDGSWERMS
ncbi:hypothetical protein COU76_05805 [Candidatus Peregrinibacteria bacterium CG10_big_fil_rev_8_21_14_0_10_49_10]|nr:MAG: hypothetical protein COU76_05805 [Candidatus Peregrinibacteria bacterium CG10_big_fil_rev_8_21_14_0_10_49_10]